MDPKDRDTAILVVEDSIEDCHLIEAILDAAGFTLVTVAQNLREARRAVSEREYGVLLVDLNLPDGSGLDALDAARARCPHAEAVVLTAYRLFDTAVASLKARAYAFLTKPCASEELVCALERAAEKYRLSKALAERTQQLENLCRTLDDRVRDATREIFDLNEKLKRTVEELTRANKGQTRFLEDIAHEIRNPLTVVAGYASFLMRKPAGQWPAEDLSRGLGSILRNAQHIAAMVEELLESVRIDARKITLTRARLTADDLVREVVEGLGAKALEAGVFLSAQLPGPGKVRVFADPNRLRQILLNLVMNAIKFTPSGGKVTVWAFQDGERARFCVEDTGRGLTPEQARRVFERFYQTDDSESRNGLGLGLHIVRGLVRLQEGRIWLDSEPGRGTRFHFILPANPSVAGAPPAALTPIPRPGARRSP
jgi:signal transduction histidine kinase